MAREPKCALAGRVCPKNGDPKKGDYCPAWWTIREQNKESGQTRDREDCGIMNHLPRMLLEHAAHVQEAAQSMQSGRNEVARNTQAVTMIGASLAGQVQALRQEQHEGWRQLTERERRQLTDGEPAK